MTFTSPIGSDRYSLLALYGQQKIEDLETLEHELADMLYLILHNFLWNLEKCPYFGVIFSKYCSVKVLNFWHRNLILDLYQPLIVFSDKP